MIYVNLPQPHTERQLTFYLAMEEYVARYMPPADYFFMWQVAPTVIFGRNQLIQNEVNTDFCRHLGIKMFRRKSGGGCVYADMNNIMFSYITRSDEVSITFSEYVDTVADILRQLGVPAKTSGRNDILIEGRKVSGNAFYHIPGRSIVHGTMLYDTDMVNMVGAITPSDDKLMSKGIQSVRQHITLLKDYITLGIEEFKSYVKQSLCGENVTLNEDAVEEIGRIEKEYLSPKFIYGNNPRYNITKCGRIEGVGDFVISMELKNGEIKDIDINGDFFLVGDVGKVIVETLRGKRLITEDLEVALPERLDDIILNLRKEDFIRLLTQ